MIKTQSSDNAASGLAPIERIEERIHFIRGQKVMLDSDLAQLYDVETSNLNKAVRRNLDRFPEDFMFQLTPQEAGALRFQIGISNTVSRGGRRYLPYVFTEQGVAMLSSILRSKRAVQANIAIMRAFIRLRSVLAAHKELARRLESLEKQTKDNFSVVFKLLSKVMAEEEKPKKQIGFRTPEKK